MSTSNPRSDHNDARSTLRDRLRRQFGWMTPLRHTSPSGERVLAADAGFVLLEVLFGLALFMLIVVYALENFGGLRQRAEVGQATTDAEKMAQQVEFWIQDHPNNSPNACLIACDSSQWSNDKDEWGWFAFDMASGTYAFCIQHSLSNGGGPPFDVAVAYQSAFGAVTASKMGSGCVSQASMPSNATAVGSTPAVNLKSASSSTW